MSVICESGFVSDDIVKNGNKFLLGNGYLGYRGTLDEYGAGECVGLNIAGFYDGLPDKWRETVNAFNPFSFKITAGGKQLSVFGDCLKEHRISLDLQRAVFERESVFGVDGANVRLHCERFVSGKRKNVLCSRITLVADCDISLEAEGGIDSNVWDLNGPHLINAKQSFCGKIAKISAVAQESNTPVSVQCAFSVAPHRASGAVGKFAINLKKDVPFVLDRVAFVLVNGEQAKNISYDEAMTEHICVWADNWQRCGVKIEGDRRAELALEYSIYHLMILAPKGDYSIAARGLSGQTYKGAVFWDTEIYMLPFYMNCMPEVAKNLVLYRIRTLPEAMKKAQYYGYRGAFYAWESQDGYDACSDFNVTDAFTNRPVKTYFKDKQIHISADVAYAVLEYFNRTGDDRLMLDGGLETVLQCVEFARSYSYYNHIKGRYELLDVIGPDEYHERVNNNAFTNYAFYFAAINGVAVAKKLAKKYGAQYKKCSLPDIGVIEDWAQQLYLPQPDSNGIIEQFDGYFRLEDTDVPTVRSRLVKPNEYWGGSGGVATATRVIKQADLIALFNLYPDKFPLDIQQANYNFYEMYTEHGSSLSQCAYALTACRTGNSSGAYNAFLSSAEIDLQGGGKQWAGALYIGGTHPAASGGAWLAAIYGFAGMGFEGGKPIFHPAMPEGIESIEFEACGRRVKIDARGEVL